MNHQQFAAVAYMLEGPPIFFSNLVLLASILMDRKFARKKRADFHTGIGIIGHVFRAYLHRMHIFKIGFYRFRVLQSKISLKTRIHPFDCFDLGTGLILLPACVMCLGNVHVGHDLFRKNCAVVFYQQNLGCFKNQFAFTVNCSYTGLGLGLKF